MLVGLIIGLFTAFGDLFESYLKRINNKKDSSKLNSRSWWNFR